MALLNVANVDYRCPHCGNLVNGWGLEFRAGRLVRAEIRIGEKVPWKDNHTPQGAWNVEGLGHCRVAGNGLMQLVGLRMIGSWA
jgi:hypothetical protein